MFARVCFVYNKKKKKLQQKNEQFPLSHVVMLNCQVLKMPGKKMLILLGGLVKKPVFGVFCCMGFGCGLNTKLNEQSSTIHFIEKADDILNLVTQFVLSQEEN